MALTRCDRGHFYDPGQHSTCPHCTIPGIDLAAQAGAGTASVTAGATRPPSSPALPGRAADGSTVRLGDGAQAPASDGRTVGLVQKKLGIDPVVGWLVCVDGPDRGRDYRIRSGRNFIGRADSMHVCIHGDAAVSREKHAVLSYDPRHRRFKVAPGEGTQLTYLNGETVDAPAELQARDVIELGETRLMFVPFCGDGFQWAAGDA